jgi:hypothetical protein
MPDGGRSLSGQEGTLDCTPCIVDNRTMLAPTSTAIDMMTVDLLSSPRPTRTPAESANKR